VAGKTSKHHMLRVGVTGGIGSGKSLVCSFLQAAGIPMLFADPLAKELMVSDGTLRKKLRDLLGPEAYQPDGSLDREWIASRLFSDPALQKKINALVHPRVEAALFRSFDELEREGEYVAAVEAALIYEAGLDRHLDAVIVVDAPEELRIRRVMERDGRSRAEVLRRMNAQWSPQRKAAKATYLIRNDGSRDQLESATRFIASLLITMAREAQAT
jgi:dephospho-CoA kinase